MSKKGQMTSLVKEYNIKSAQIQYLSKPPTSILTKIDPKFILEMESKSNPAQAYKRAMNQLHLDELSKSLQERRQNLSIGTQGDENKKDYQSRVNGVLYELQKNNLAYSLLLQRKMNQQQERKERFVDDSKRKNERIDSFVQLNEDKNVFNHQSDLYQQYQRSQLSHSLSMLQLQKDSRVRENQIVKQQKQRQFEKRIEYERQLQTQKRQERENYKKNQLKYQNELEVMVLEKRRKNQPNKYISSSRNERHNPITNPIQYHIQNPYLLKRLSEQQEI